MKEVTVLLGGIDYEGEKILRVYSKKEVAEHEFNQLIEEHQKSGERMPYDYYDLQTFKVEET